MIPICTHSLDNVTPSYGFKLQVLVSLPRRRHQDGIGCARPLHVVKRKRSSRRRDHDDTCEKRGGRKEVKQPHSSLRVSPCWWGVPGAKVSHSSCSVTFRNGCALVPQPRSAALSHTWSSPGESTFCVNMVVDLEGLSVK